jgi:hypothetical protein
MSDLTLVHRSKTIPESSWGPDQYSVIHDGMTVGSIVKQAMAGTETQWFWEIMTRESPGLLKGLAPSREDAMAAFREAWEGLTR